MGSVLRICLDCTAAYAVGLVLCPHCGSERAMDQDTDPYRGGTEPMPKITKHGGPSVAGENPDVEGGGPSSLGDSSSRSETKPVRPPKKSPGGVSKRARTTGSPTAPGKTGSSTARSTGTGPTAPTSETTSPDED